MNHKNRLEKLETQRGTSDAMTWRKLITFSAPEWQAVIQSNPQMAAAWARVAELLDIAKARRDANEQP